jgi:hypothetical protein
MGSYAILPTRLCQGKSREARLSIGRFSIAPPEVPNASVPISDASRFGPTCGDVAASALALASEWA